MSSSRLQQSLAFFAQSEPPAMLPGVTPLSMHAPIYSCSTSSYFHFMSAATIPAQSVFSPRRHDSYACKPMVSSAWELRAGERITRDAFRSERDHHLYGKNKETSGGDRDPSHIDCGIAERDIRNRSTRTIAPRQGRKRSAATRASA